MNLDNSDPKAGKVPTVQIDLCFDVSEVDVVDANGKSVVSPDRPDTGWIRFLVSNYEWDADPDGGMASRLQPGHRAHAMRRLVARVVVTSLAVAGLLALAPGPAYADTGLPGHGPRDRCLPDLGRGAGHSRRPGRSGDDGPKDTGTGAACYWDGTDQGITKPPPGPVPCSSEYGYWSNGYNCYISLLDPQPPAGDPNWQGHEPGDGAVYNCYQPQTDLLIWIWSPTRHRTPGPGRRRARSRRSPSSRWTSGRSTSASRPSLARTASASSACRCGCGQPTPTATRSDRSPSRPPPVASRSPRRRGFTRSPGTWETAPRSSARRPARRTRRRTASRSRPTAGTSTRSPARPSRAGSTPSPRPRTGSSPGTGAGQTGTIRLNGLTRSVAIAVGEAQVLVQ